MAKNSAITSRRAFFLVYTVVTASKGYVPGVSFKVLRRPLLTEPVNRAKGGEVINILYAGKAQL